MSVLGAILTGGRASRFGSDKALAPLNGRPLIAHVADGLRPHVARLVTCGGPARLADVPHLADRPAPGLGPLGGLCAALTAAAAGGEARVLSAGCDTPKLPAPLLNRLLAEPGPAFLASLPLIGVWPSADADALAEWLRTDPRRSVRGWAERSGARALTTDQPLANINTPEDLRDFRS